MKKVLAILLLSVLLLTGCSSGANPSADVTIKWDNGVMSYNGTTFDVNEYNGFDARVESGQGGLSYRLTLDTAKDVTNITVNTQEILEENMSKYKGGYYYSEYLGSMITYAKNLGGDNWAVCQVVSKGTADNLCATYAESYVSTVPLTNGQVYVDFGNFIFGNAYDLVSVRKDGAVIVGTAKVSKDSYDCNTPVTVIQDNKEYSLMKGSSAKYDYYMYDGYLIQIAGGLDISSYIKFK